MTTLSVRCFGDRTTGIRLRFSRPTLAEEVLDAQCRARKPRIPINRSIFRWFSRMGQASAVCFRHDKAQSRFTSRLACMHSKVWPEWL